MRSSVGWLKTGLTLLLVPSLSLQHIKEGLIKVEQTPAVEVEATGADNIRKILASPTNIAPIVATEAMSKSESAFTVEGPNNRLLSVPLWLVILFWVIAIPLFSILALMLFVGTALALNGCWQKQVKADEIVDTRKKKRLLPSGWGVHLNDEGNIYYVHQATGM
ncbi:hypothetical protein AAMO2058_000909000 [Amorphochlora amoebiformis]